jgi:hypothetical protein
MALPAPPVLDLPVIFWKDEHQHHTNRSLITVFDIQGTGSQHMNESQLEREKERRSTPTE